MIEYLITFMFVIEGEVHLLSAVRHSYLTIKVGDRMFFEEYGGYLRVADIELDIDNLAIVEVTMELGYLPGKLDEYEDLLEYFGVSVPGKDRK